MPHQARAGAAIQNRIGDHNSRRPGQEALALAPSSPRRSTTDHAAYCLEPRPRGKDNQKSDLYPVVGPQVTLLGCLKVVQSCPLLWCYAVGPTATRPQRKRRAQSNVVNFWRTLLGCHRRFGGLDQPFTQPKQPWSRFGLPNMLNDRVLSSVYAIGQIDHAARQPPRLDGALPWPSTYVDCPVASALIGTPMSRQFAGWHVNSST